MRCPECDQSYTVIEGEMGYCALCDDWSDFQLPPGGDEDSSGDPSGLVTEDRGGEFDGFGYSNPRDAAH